MRPKINFITLAVEDLTKSISFYENAFGFPVSDVNENLCLFELEDDFYLVLSKKEDFLTQGENPNPDTNSFGFILSHSTETKKELENIVAKAEKFGAKRVKVLDEEWGYSITIKDIDGHHWEIVFTNNDTD